MKNVLAGTVVALLVWSAAPLAQQAQPAQPGATDSAPTSAAASTDSSQVDNLTDLASMTFGCPKAALNAAAREASKVRSRGTYQFAFFRIVSGSHHAAYEVHFKSNFSGEKDLKYCVAIYCQQGWDPRTTQATVTLMNDPRQAPAAGHAAHCAAPTTTERRAR